MWNLPALVDEEVNNIDCLEKVDKNHRVRYITMNLVLEGSI